MTNRFSFILRRAKALVSPTKRLGGGDMGGRTGPPRGPGELSRNAVSLVDMADALERRQERTADLLQTNEALQAEIAQRRRAEETLGKLSRAIEQTGDSIVVTDRDGIIEYVNPAFERLTGYTAAEAMGKTPRILSSGQHDAPFFERLWKTILSGQDFRSVFINRKKDGQLYHQENVITPIRDSHGTISHFVSVGRDITERMHAEEALRKLSRAVEQAADSILIANRHGIIEYVNPAFERLTGYAREEAVGQTPAILKSGEHDRRFYEELWTRILSGQTFRDVFVNRKKTGELYHADEIITPLSDARGEITHFVSSARDITERIRMERELRGSRERLRTMAAHLESVREEERKRIAREIHDELGQVLTGLKIDLSWLVSRLPRDLPALREKADAMVTLVDATIDSVGRIAEELRPTTLDRLGLMAAIEGLAREFQARTGIRCHFASNVRDPDQRPDLATTMFRICQEALTNVARHANAGHVAITLSRRATGLLLTIEDDGKGITPQQISDSKSLGLLGMRERARIHGGSVVITGVARRGTTVTVSFPFTKPAHESSGSPPSAF